jgi:hypothetical protein
VPFFPASCLEDHAQPRWRSSSSSLAPWLSVALSHSLSLSLTRSLSCNPPSLLSRPLSLSLFLRLAIALGLSFSLPLLTTRAQTSSSTLECDVRFQSATDSRGGGPRRRTAAVALLGSAANASYPEVFAGDSFEQPAVETKEIGSSPAGQVRHGIRVSIS